MKFSFDFDDTLSLPSVQRYALAYIKQGHDVHIVTSRKSNEQASNDSWNDDLFLVASLVGIPEENVHFCNLTPKHLFFAKNPDFRMHIDDDKDEVDGINYHCKENIEGVYFVDTFNGHSFKRINEIIRSEP